MALVAVVIQVQFHQQAVLQQQAQFKVTQEEQVVLLQVHLTLAVVAVEQVQLAQHQHRVALAEQVALVFQVPLVVLPHFMQAVAVVLLTAA